MGFTHDVIVIGAGSAGLTVSGGLGRLGLRVALIEESAMGGECLNTGCVPSKALLAAGRAAQAVREAGRFGVHAEPPRVVWAEVRTHVERAMANIAPHDSVTRFEAWGVEVIRHHARLAGPHEVEAGGRRLSAPRVVLATGSRPVLPPIAGLAAPPALTNETLFRLEALPRRLLVLGGGPIGCEMAQAFRRLGAEVVVIEKARCLAGGDGEAAALVVARLRAEGIEVFENAEVVEVESSDGAIRVRLDAGRMLEGSHLLVAAGRIARTEGLGLEVAGVTVGADGIVVDRHLRTSVRSIHAVGDCRAGPRFTHAAGMDGERLVAALGFGLSSRVDRRALPRVTYTDPELAEAGRTETGDGIEVLRQDFADNDRAITDGERAGFLKVFRRRSRVIGVTIVGIGAGELLAPWLLAMCRRRATLWTFSGLTLPYPTRGEIAKAAAFSAYEPRLFSRPARVWAGALARSRRLTASRRSK